MKFTAKLHGRDIDGECVNPGEWFGKAWIIEIAVGCSVTFYCVEADCPSDAIDEFCDSEKWGKLIHMDEEYHKEQLIESPDDIHYAGNDCRPVDLENVGIYGQDEGIKELKYQTGEMTPEEYVSR